MAISFFQKLRLGLRVWNRRRTEAAARRDAAFLARATGWGKTAESKAPVKEKAAGPAVDLEGLQVAYLEGSGAIEHYLDSQTGDVVELRSGEDRSAIDGGGTRYWRVPQRTVDSEAADRFAFIATIDKPAVRRNLEIALQSANAPAEFRKALSADRAVERAWYNFKNDRAAEAITRWLESLPPEVSWPGRG